MMLIKTVIFCNTINLLVLMTKMHFDCREVTVKLSLSTPAGHTGVGGEEVRFHSSLNLCTRWRLVSRPPPIYSLNRGQVSPMGLVGVLVKEEYFSTARIRTKDRSARNQSLYRLPYIGPVYCEVETKILNVVEINSFFKFVSMISTFVWRCTGSC